MDNTTNKMRELTRKELTEEQTVLFLEYDHVSLDHEDTTSDSFEMRTVAEELDIVSRLLYQDHHVGDWVYYTSAAGRLYPTPYLIMGTTETQCKLLSADQKKIMVNHDRVECTNHLPATAVVWKGNRYLVTSKNAIVSLVSGRIMKWSDENGDRKGILEAAKLERS
tara:strand:+ start:118 stop:615 length:498 start_codon:yes stop_codon:yes gene_type:complete